MKHLRLFSNDSMYQQFIESESYVEPNVSYVTDSSKVFYNPMKPKVRYYSIDPGYVIGDYANYKVVIDVENSRTIEGIVELSVGSYMASSGNSYFDEYWTNWSVNEHNSIVKDERYDVESLNGFKFVIGDDGKDFYQKVGASSNNGISLEYVHEISEEEYLAMIS